MNNLGFEGMCSTDLCGEDPHTLQHVVDGRRHLHTGWLVDGDVVLIVRDDARLSRVHKLDSSVDHHVGQQPRPTNEPNALMAQADVL